MRAIPPHENVVSLLYAKDASPRRIVVMPLLEGGSLESYYEHTAGVIPPLVMRQLLKQVALGLAHMHSSKERIWISSAAMCCLKLPRIPFLATAR